MKIRIGMPLAIAAAFFVAALATGSPILWMPGVLILLAVTVCFFSVIWAAGTMHISAELDHPTVYRGEEAQLILSFHHRGWIPISPVALEIESSPGTPLKTVFLRDVPGKRQTLSLPFHADHVGVSVPGIRSCTIEDLMGFFSLKRVNLEQHTEMLVLPRCFDTEPLILSPGDPGSELISRATEDLSAPSDIRSYQVGDPMKKIHWKLSLRKQELMVRKFEAPILQDVLILMDCSRPPSWGHPEAEADIRDAMLETASSVFQNQCGNDLTVHLPLFGVHPVELEKSMGMPLLLENLARADFSETDRFERVLLLESRRLRKVGCLVVISARLNSQMVDIMKRMRQIGPNIRCYLITFAPDDSRVLPLTGSLQQSGIEVVFIKPDHTAIQGTTEDERR